MTPIQAQAIPHILRGRDLIGLAQTGTGKTAAFSLPLLQMLLKGEGKRSPKTAKALILAPTRELAVQIGENVATYGKHLHLRSLLVYGGVSERPQIKAMQKGVDILVATPGRLLDLVQQGHIDLGMVSFLIFDEADRMLDMGFIKDIEKIMSYIRGPRQTLLFSATMPKGVEQLAQKILNNPERVSVSPQATTAEKVEQRIMMVPTARKRDLLEHVMKNPEVKRVIIFTRTKHGANRVSKFLDQMGISSAAIHGNKSQNARQKSLNSFQRGDIRALVATDVAARGIDVDDITHVINFDLPNEPESYVHRIGRTARAGASGIAISFCDRDERAYLKDIEKIIRDTIPRDYEHPWQEEATAMLFQDGEEIPVTRPKRNGGGSRGQQSRRPKGGAGGGGKSFGKPRSGGKPGAGKPGGGKPGGGARRRSGGGGGRGGAGRG